MLAALWTGNSCVVVDPWAHASRPAVEDDKATTKRARAAYPSDDDEDDAPAVESLKRPKPPPRPVPLIHVSRSHAAALQLVSAVDDTLVLTGNVKRLSRLAEQQTGVVHVPARINCGVSASVPMPRARSRVVPIGWDD
jgi:hypothetical protein